MNPQTMKCIEISTPGGPEVLTPGERPLPTCGPDEVLIKIAAAGVNRPDVIQRKGAYPPPPGASDLLGLEAAGEIIACGEQVDNWQIGDKVCALLNGGGYAEYATAHSEVCLPIPKGLSTVEAAALPETFFTVWHNVFERAALQPGEIFLVHGGTSGIGTTAIQMAKAFGARVFATAGSDEKCRVCEQLGAEKAFNYHSEDFVKGIKATTKGANVILDMIGGDYIQKNIKATAPKARIVSIAFLRGSKVEVDFGAVMLKQLVLTGSTLRSQPLENKIRIAAGLKEKVWPLLDAGTIKPVIHSQFTLSEASQAHQLMESNAHIGKIVLIP
ncbi:MAG: NAD(P)H-quinone oxidoreductase [Gammaproteobacteria bacterium]|nr:NAD(P)H-quinone oxidoreductase [Gammaproteobacteria bacterium]MBQ0838569.1 NAD(P)H-quinone oxidoreductase [Gammaproteobacteria bacterium]